MKKFRELKGFALLFMGILLTGCVIPYDASRKVGEQNGKPIYDVPVSHGWTMADGPKSVLIKNSIEQYCPNGYTELSRTKPEGDFSRTIGGPYNGAVGQIGYSIRVLCK